MRISDWSSDVCSSDLLHRLEAACLDENAPSQRLLRRAGFRPEGTLRAYLKIDCVWRDHQLHARLVTDGPVPGLPPPGRTVGPRVGKDGVRSCHIRWSPLP